MSTVAWTKSITNLVARRLWPHLRERFDSEINLFDFQRQHLAAVIRRLKRWKRIRGFGRIPA